MSDHYEDFLKRLIQYRIRLNMTQEKTSQALGVTQSQLSKQELGKTIMPYKALVILLQMGWDVDYLLTGRHSMRSPSELTAVLSKAGQSYRKPMLKFITWAITVGVEQSMPELSMEVECELCILKMRGEGGKHESIMYEIRQVTGDSQVTMAEKLGVNIKKYRALEKVEINPDAELLLGIYEVTGCKPSLFLTTDQIENLIIDDLWSQIKPEKREEILSIVLQVEKFLRD